MNRKNICLLPAYVLNCLQANQRGDAELFKALFGGQFRHSRYERRNQWFIKNAGRWEPDVMGEVFNAVEGVAGEYDQTADNIAAKISGLLKSGSFSEVQRQRELQEAALRRAFWLRSGAGQSACLKMARRDPAFSLRSHK